MGGNHIFWDSWFFLTIKYQGIQRKSIFSKTLTKFSTLVPNKAILIVTIMLGEGGGYGRPLPPPHHPYVPPIGEGGGYGRPLPPPHHPRLLHTHLRLPRLQRWLHGKTKIPLKGLSQQGLGIPLRSSLKIGHFKERPWANRSRRSLKKIDVSDSRLIWANCSLKMGDSFEKFVFFRWFWQFVPFFMPKSQSLPMLFAHLLFFKERLDWFALVTLHKRATMSDSLRLLMTKKQLWAIRSGCSWQKSNESNLLFFTSKSFFLSQKTSELLEKLMSEFPTLVSTLKHLKMYQVHNTRF